MATLQFFPPAPTEELREHIAQVYARRSEAIQPLLVEAHIGDWQPEPNCCHDNVDTWVEYHGRHEGAKYQTIRGWLLFDLGGSFPCVKLVAHSIIKTDDGQYIDITPRQNTTPYPFIPIEIDEDRFRHYQQALHAQHGEGSTHHYLD